MFTAFPGPSNCNPLLITQDELPNHECGKAFAVYQINGGECISKYGGGDE